VLTPAQLSAVGHLPGVAAVSPVLGYTAKATSAVGTRNVAIAGGDLASAPVNTVPLMSGRLPGPARSWPTQAFLSSLFLISATMNTLIAEQAGEIAILKTLGGRRRQIGGIALRTATMLGAAAAVVGTILGIVIAYLLTRYFALKLIDVSFGFGISAPVVVASLVLGPALGR
jgi:hypothetical protein